MILVAGATGLLGFEVCRQLREKGELVAGLVRPGSNSAHRFDDIAVQRRVGDLKDRASLEAACLGARVVVSTATATMRRGKGDSLKTVDRDGQLRLIACAASAGVRRFVYVSLSPNASDCPLVRYKRDVEQAIRASGMAWSILQPGPFLDLWVSERFGWDFRRGRAAILGRGDKPVSFICVYDVARFVVAAASQDSLLGRITPLGGPEALTACQLVETCQQLTGRRFRARSIPAVVLRIARRILFPFDLPTSLTTLALDLAERGDPIDMKESLRLVPIRLRTAREFMSAAMGIGTNP